MTHCEKCIHYDICDSYYGFDDVGTLICHKDCKDFKDKGDVEEVRHEYSSALGLIEPQPCTIEIVNCNRITVGLKDFDVDVDLLPDYFAQIDKIIINGTTFVRVRELGVD